MKSNYFGRACQIVGVLFAAAFASAPPASAQQAAGAAFVEGEALFVRNKPAEAAARLEAALIEDPANVTAALYLGIAYQQTERYDAAIETLRAALPRAGEKTALFSYNIGNAYFAKGAAAFADQFYSKALEADPGMASAYLNRANARVRTGALQDAVADYGRFLTLVPDSPKRPDIEKLIALIGAEAAAAEKARQDAEEAARAEEERRRRLLDEVAASLQAAAEETKGLSSESEDVMQYDGEFVLE